MIRALPLALAFAAALLASPTPTHAQEDARSLFRAGVESLREGEFTDAERAFLASYEIEPRAATLCNLALTYDRWGGHEEQAARAYERCAAEDDTGRYRAHATQRASDIRQALSLRQALGSPPPEPEAADAPNPFMNDAPPPTEPEDGEEVEVAEHRAPGTEPPSRSHGLLWGGLVSALAGGGLFLGGAVLAGNGRDDLDELDMLTGGGGGDTVLLEPGSPEAQLYRDAERKRTTALGLYVGGAVLVALGATLVVLDVATGQLEGQVYATPTRGGAFLQAELRLPR